MPYSARARHSAVPPRALRSGAPRARPANAMARLLWSLALALALLAVQGQAQLHLIGHAGESLQGEGASKAPATFDQTESDGEHLAAACLECLALAGVDTPLGNPAAGRCHPPTALRSAQTASIPAPGAPPLQPRCRAPPASPLFAPLA